MPGDYRTIKEISEDWGISARRIQILCTEGRIQGAFKRGRTWLIPLSAERPDDRRVKTTDTSEKFFSSDLQEKDVDFLYSFLHEMRQHVSSILGFSELASTHIKDEVASAEYLNNITNSGKELLEMARNFATIIQVERGEIEPDFKVCNIDSSIEKAFENLRKCAHEQSIIPRCSKTIAHKFVYVDDILWDNVIVNITNMIIRNTQRGGSASIKVLELENENPDKCTLHVSISISGGTVGRNFSKFQRTDIQFLAIKRAIEFLEGHFINATDNFRPDNYSYSSSDIKMVFEVPFNIAKCEVDDENRDVDFDITKYKSKRVLIADDNLLNRTAAQMILEDEGFDVETAEDGIFAVAMVERALSDYYGLILMDLQMANVNGTTATKLIRGLKDKGKSSIPIIAMTANVSEKDKKEALAAGMNGFLEKPVDINRVYEVLKEIDNG